MKFAKCLRGYHRFAKIEALTDRGVQNPGGCKDSYTRIALEADMLTITAIEGPENLHIRVKIGMPSIMNTTNLPDMGRMNGNWGSAGKTGYLPGPTPARKPWHVR